MFGRRVVQSRSLPARGRVGLEVHRCLCIIDAGNVFATKHSHPLLQLALQRFTVSLAMCDTPRAPCAPAPTPTILPGELEACSRPSRYDIRASGRACPARTRKSSDPVSCRYRSDKVGSPCKVNQYTSQSRGESTPNPTPSLTHSITQHPMPCEGVFSDHPLSFSLSLTLTTAQTFFAIGEFVCAPILSLSRTKLKGH